MMEAVHSLFAWLSAAPAVVQCVFVIVAGIVAVFSFSDHSLHGFATRWLKAAAKRK